VLLAKLSEGNKAAQQPTFAKGAQKEANSISHVLIHNNYFSQCVKRGDDMFPIGRTLIIRFFYNRYVFRLNMRQLQRQFLDDVQDDFFFLRL
jgi:hypothetical protein